MKKFAILMLAFVMVFSGCVDEVIVKKGDIITVDYTESLEDGTVLVTTIEGVAKEQNIFSPEEEYKPFKFTVGKGDTISGFSDGVIGMSIGETKVFTITPEKGFGRIKPELIRVYPVIETIPARIPRVIEIPYDRFVAEFKENYTAGDIVTLPDTGIEMTVKSISQNVLLAYNYKAGDQMPSYGAPWNITVARLDEKNITVKYSVKKNDTVQFPNVLWNTTIIDVNDESIVIKNNAIPDTEIEGVFGQMTRVRFNETSIIMDQNHKLAGMNLTFSVTLISIEEKNKE
ncbi:MAG: FKBP-type peptidyl-prolyl cis-trans isomerase [Candidatus Methanoperedens sp.]|jgi:FKBP-type peptidyl-prolyl cis-trans isomerase 2|nr:FKBP-type peptidyl-prolyl cis-trans isomerase [Candidatus Methanoperedens sp.]PKL53515.1 MAG: hypothetical protein CVV36_06705 [Candidatus Methanoperedenaceae archaeon HGW-Methanoperedenaceae-1]